MAEPGIDYDPETGAPRYREAPVGTSGGPQGRFANGRRTNNAEPTPSSAAELEEITVTGRRTLESIGKISFNSDFKREKGVGQSLNDLAYPDKLRSGGMPFIKFDVFEVNTVNPGTTVTSTASQASITGGLTSAVRLSVGAFNKTTDAIGGTVRDLAGKTITNTVQDVASAASQVASGAVKEVIDPEKIKNLVSGLFTDFSLSRYADTFTRSICLPIPEGVQTQYAQDWGEISLTNALGNLGFAAQAVAEPEFMTKNDPYLTELALKLGGKFLPGSNEDLTNVLQFGATGRVVNPQQEMLYRSPRFREFVFDFRLVPRNRIDAANIKEIIRTLKSYSAPQFCGTTTGRYYIPPAKFAFTFFRGDGDFNTNLFRSKQCVIKNISVDYAPNGYATHDDDFPVETRLQLVLTETSMITKEDIDSDYF